MALFIGTLVVGNFFVSSDKAVSRQSAGHDFLAFYTAGTFVRTGRSAELYDLSAVKTFQRDVVARERLEVGAENFGPFWNPPFFAWVFVPLSMLSYGTAWVVWFIVNLVCAACAIVILCQVLSNSPQRKLGVAHANAISQSACNPPLPRGAIAQGREGLVDWRTWGLVPLLVITSLPFIQALGHGQNTCISLLLLCGTVALWRGERLIAAGAVAGLLFYKPQLGAVIATALVLREGFKPLAGLALTGSALLLATLTTLPGALVEFLHALPRNIAFMQVEHRYLWERHVTLKAFWRLLLQGYAVGDMTSLTRAIYVLSTAIAAACLFATILKRRSDRDAATRDRIIAATIVAMPLLMPFYFDYDLLLLSVAAVLVAREGAIEKPLLIGWIALYAWLFVNHAVAAATHVNVTVLLLAAVATMLIARACRRPVVVPQDIDQPHELRQAA